MLLPFQIDFLFDGKKVAQEKSVQQTKKLKALHNKLNEIETYKAKLKKMANTVKTENPSFKQIIIYKDKVDKFET